MQWVELRLVVARTRVDALGKLAFAHGSTGVQEDEAPGSPRRFRQPWDTEDPPVPMHCLFRAWFAPEAADAAEAALQEHGEVERLVVREEDWGEQWKKHHHRVAISDELAVAPPWEALPGDIVIEPGQAFGTGDHPTTLACLGAIARLAPGLTRCLDVGCGSGVLALAFTAVAFAMMRRCTARGHIRPNNPRACDHLSLHWWSRRCLTPYTPLYLGAIVVSMALLLPPHIAAVQTTVFLGSFAISMHTYACGSASLWCWTVAIAGLSVLL